MRVESPWDRVDKSAWAPDVANLADQLELERLSGAIGDELRGGLDGARSAFSHVRLEGLSRLTAAVREAVRHPASALALERALARPLFADLAPIILCASLGGGASATNGAAQQKRGSGGAAGGAGDAGGAGGAGPALDAFTAPSDEEAVAAARFLGGLFLLHPPAKEAARAVDAAGVLLRRAVEGRSAESSSTDGSPESVEQSADVSAEVLEALLSLIADSSADQEAFVSAQGAAQVAKVVQKELERRKRLGSPAAAAGSSGGSAFGSLEGLLQLLVGRVLQKEADQRAVRDAVGKAVGGAEAKRLFGDAAA